MPEKKHGFPLGILNGKRRIIWHNVQDVMVQVMTAVVIFVMVQEGIEVQTALTKQAVLAAAEAASLDVLHAAAQDR